MCNIIFILSVTLSSESSNPCWHDGLIDMFSKSACHQCHFRLPNMYNALLQPTKGPKTDRGLIDNWKYEMLQHLKNINPLKETIWFCSANFNLNKFQFPSFESFWSWLGLFPTITVMSQEYPSIQDIILGGGRRSRE